MRLLPTLSAAAVFCLCGTASNAAPVVFSAIGTNPAGISATVDAFRASLGANNNNDPAQASGRREIGWDGMNDAVAAPNLLPADFFNTTVPRGVVFSTAGTGFMQSADSSNPTSTPILFDNLLTNLGSGVGSTNFQTFSSPRLFTAIGSTTMNVDFFLAGTTTAALTRGFGVVFTDTDDGADSVTGIEFFDAGDVSLGFFNAPANSTNANLSFIGVDFGTAVVSSVRITAGKCPLPNTNGCNDAGDVVVMDDFIYGEPVLAAVSDVPAPASLLLLGAALSGLGLARRRA